MGCGAICGDTPDLQTSNFNYSQRIMLQLLPLLNKNSHLAQPNTYRQFLAHYHQDVPSFHLKPQSKLIANEPVSQQVRTKWKLILYGLDSDHADYCNCLGLVDQKQQLKNQEEGSVHSQPHELLQHAEFRQIEKDISRTLPIPENRKKQFENVLKRITNFFPKMGYTQGLNFIIGYLILVGYSQSDSFWMFVHIAINRRYLLLGLFEDMFPLSSVLDRLFRNLLKREDSQLFEHIFNGLQIQPALWTFKWFTTCFLYSFPIQMIKYVWDLLIQVGCFAIVTFAVSLTRQLASAIYQISDMSDFCELISSLSNIESFNQHIDMQIVINQSYKLSIIPEDFEGEVELKGFYAQYFQTNTLFQAHSTSSNMQQTLTERNQFYSQKINRLLQKFYNALIEQRKQLKTSKAVPLLLNTVTKNMPKQQQYNDSLSHVLLGAKDVAISRMQTDIQKPEENTRQSVVAYETHQKDQGNRLPEHMKEVRSKVSQTSKQQQLDKLDELDKFEIEYSKKTKMDLKINNFSVQNLNQRFKKPKQSKQQQTSLFTQTKSKSKQETNKATNIRVLHGQNILKIQSCDAVSVSSKHTNRSTNRNKKAETEEPKSIRICGCKTKTQENNSSRLGPKSEQGQLKEAMSDKDSISNKQYSQNEDYPNDNVSFQNQDNQKRGNQYMVSSHGPTLKQKQEPLQIKKNQNENDVEVLPPFKKDKRHKQYGVFEISSMDNKQKMLSVGLQREKSVESIIPVSNQLISIQPISIYGQNSEISRCQIQSIR